MHMTGIYLLESGPNDTLTLSTGSKIPFLKFLSLRLGKTQANVTHIKEVRLGPFNVYLTL